MFRGLGPAALVFATMIFPLPVLSAGASQCVSAEQADAMTSPVDLAEHILACFGERRDDRAAELLILMQLRTKFDAERVADETAKLGGQVLSLTLRQKAGPEWKERINRAAGALLQPESERFTAFCGLMHRLGPPRYHPDYMIQHGMEDYRETGEAELVAGFDAGQEWAKLIGGYLRCK